MATAAVIAACFGEASEGTRTQASLVPDRTVVTFPTTMVGMSSNSGPITLQNQFTSEDNTILSIGPSVPGVHTTLQPAARRVPRVLR